MPVVHNFVFCFLLCAGVAAIPSGTGAAPTLEECTNLLEYGTEYYQELDAPDQRAALMSFYYSTGGAYWTSQLISNAEQQQFSQLVAELEEAGYELSDQQLNVSSLPADLVSDLANLPALSVNCALQQWLSFGQLLLKHQWGSSVSYCHWYGVSCCKTSGDQLNQYCSAPQSVATLTLQGMNVSGTIPQTVFSQLVDLQTLMLDDNPGLGGTVPNLGSQISSKITSLSLQNTSLIQCNATHLAALHGTATPGEVVNAGISSSMAADNMTGCLPDVWQFCELNSAGQDTNLMCPSVAYRRPVQFMSNQLVQLQIFLGILADTHNLTLATLNVSSSVTPVSPERPPEGPPEGPERPPEGPKGPQAGPKGPPEGSGVVPGPFEAVGCNGGVLGEAGNAASWGLATATPQMGYDISLFSYVGCRCNAGYDNVYTLTDTGGVSIQCLPTTVRSKVLEEYLPLGIGLALLLAAFVLLLVFRGRQIMTELSTARLNRIKKGHAPGTLQAGLAEELGLVHKEITLVMSDVQASSKLWEWNEGVMDLALAMHDSCLRSVLHNHQGYEVSTEGDAFTMAFHDPVDALSWALEVQHKLLLLDWPAELLTRDDAQEAFTPGSVRHKAVMFRGLRVRMALHTGKPDALQVHHVTRQVEYRGDVVNLTEALVGFPAGGQILLSGSTYQRLYGRLHTVRFDDQMPGQAAQTAISQSDATAARPGISFNSPFSAALDTTPSASSNIDLATEGSTIDLLLRASSATGTGLLQQSALGGGGGTSMTGRAHGGDVSDTAGAGGGFERSVRWLRGTPRSAWGWVKRQGLRVMPCWFGRRLAEGERETSRFRKWKPSQTDVNGMINSTVIETGGTRCVVVDMGAYHLAEFANTLCRPYVGSAVHGGIHVLQVVSRKLQPRTLTFPFFSTASKVAPSFGGAPGVISRPSSGQRPNPKYPAFHPKSQLPTEPEWPHVTMVFCGPAQYKDLLQQNVHAAESSLRHFQSCVRTTLLLSDGYECQEKDGLFMIAFSEPRGAIEWAVLLQLALLRADWSPVLEQYESTAAVLGSSGQTLFKGLSAKVGLVHGKVHKICPHNSTGRADYFGSMVNKAARLLVAAKAGQILVEAPVMEAVLKQWNGDAFHLAPVPTGSAPNTTFTAKATRGAAVLESGDLVLPELIDAPDEYMAETPRIKSAPFLSPTQNPNGNDVTASDVPLKGGGERAHFNLSAQPGQAATRGGVRGWSPRVPHTAVRSNKTGGPDRFSAVSFAPHSQSQPSSSTPLKRMPSLSSFAPGAGRSVDGVMISYDDSELEQLEVLDSCCAPHASASPLAVSNCHMLKFLAASGTLQGCKEEVVVSHRRSFLHQAASVSAGDSPRGSQDLHSSFPGATGVRSNSSSINASRRPSSLGPSDSRLPVITDAKPKEAARSRAVWTPGASEGKPFPAKGVPIEVWGIGAFKFKGIQGISKVMEVQPAELAERMELQSKTLEPGKATCIVSAHYLRCSLNVQLMDVLDLQLSL